ncbi:hypothetical protein CC78DRAFT_220293 [Lojkania enalia]|uniref:Uncharacterized protein n=1 Tax=Lojkania enalia TaxID=147567 RepID=A0A9P4KA03_9PLEO|nr:hypothetical protein CC78DRAFT_220293 [Didymosphaeria enalia]
MGQQCGLPCCTRDLGGLVGVSTPARLVLCSRTASRNRHEAGRSLQHGRHGRHNPLTLPSSFLDQQSSVIVIIPIPYCARDRRRSPCGTTARVHRRFGYARSSHRPGDFSLSSYQKRFCRLGPGQQEERHSFGTVPLETASGVRHAFSWSLLVAASARLDTVARAVGTIEMLWGIIIHNRR